ncbi:hypothetical protein V2E24_01890 [Mycoplasmopsis ciconiae]|uniref:Uncharacterized protein n=1 Tax=Mycoplasmopsis ciconiae TaxID=561067 RepID=A0ABU7MLB1_9BACT|nr:hypothetical protein [Mycoplasmopsis ciconiae]
MNDKIFKNKWGENRFKFLYNLILVFKLLGNFKIFKKLNLKFVEPLKKEDRFLVGKNNIIFTLVKGLILISLLITTFLLSFIDNSLLSAAYRYTIGMAFGNSIFIILIFSLVSYFVGIFAYLNKDKCFALFSRIRKVNSYTLKKQINISLIYLFFIVTLVQYLSYYYANNYAFEFNPSSVRLFEYSWYYQYSYPVVFENDNFLPDVKNNIGFVLNSLYVILTYISVSSILPVILLISLIFAMIIQFLFVSPFRNLAILTSKNKTILDYKKFLKLHNSDFYLSQDTQKFIDFLFFYARTKNIDVNQMSFIDLQTHAIKDFKDIDFILFEAKYKAHLQKINSDHYTKTQELTQNINQEAAEFSAQMLNNTDIQNYHQDSSEIIISTKKEDKKVKNTKPFSFDFGKNKQKNDEPKNELKNEKVEKTLENHQKSEEMPKQLEKDMYNKHVQKDNDTLKVHSNAEEVIQEQRGLKEKDKTKTKVDSLEDFLKGVSPIEHSKDK